MIFPFATHPCDVLLVQDHSKEDNNNLLRVCDTFIKNTFSLFIRRWQLTVWTSVYVVNSIGAYSAAARRVKKKWTPPHGRTKQNHIFLIQWYVGGTKWMVVKKIFEALPWLRRYSNTVSFATLTPFCAHIFQGYEWSWSDKRHVSGISDLGRAKYVAVMINNTSLH